MFDLFIIKEERTQVQTHLRIINEFFQLPLELIERVFVEEHHPQVANATYGFIQAPSSL